ncbi:MAG: AmmeMemoRadiSam system protein B [Candidatus Anammoximicrobium sp.]|mgnify:CR=1 FL=1|nr:AmmeMemoRadiSam system protein B [Candidatus Anammoximicrobium sp.]
MAQERGPAVAGTFYPRDAAPAREHCLEVQLPFLQIMLADFRIVPLLVGEATPKEIAEPLEALWGGEETLVVISSDLCR